MIKQIRIGWNGGFENIVDEYIFSVGKGYLLKNQDEINLQKKSLQELSDRVIPKNMEGFIPNEYFYFSNRCARMDTADFTKSQRDSEEVDYAWNYVMSMQTTISIKDLLFLDDRTKFSYLFQALFLELLCRNRNVKLLCNVKMTESIFAYLCKHTNYDRNKIDMFLLACLRSCAYSEINRESINNIANFSISKDGKTLDVLFTKRQNIHQSVGYPIG